MPTGSSRAAGAKPAEEKKPAPQQRQEKAEDPKPTEERRAPVVDPASDDEWSLLDGEGWLAQLYGVSGIIDACTTAKALSVMQAAPKFAGPYQAMKRHSPKTAEAVDELVRKRREALSA